MVVRKILLGLTLVSMILSVGTVGWVVAGGPLSVQSSGAAHVPNETLADNGYTNASIEHIRVNETIKSSGVSKRVNLSVYATTTSTVSTVDGSAVLTTVTLPAWKAGGLVTLNPLAYAPLPQVLELALPHVPLDIESFERVNSESTSVAGTENTVSTFHVVTGSGDDGYLYISRTVMGDDLVVVVGFHPGGADRGDELIGLMADLEK